MGWGVCSPNKFGFALPTQSQGSVRPWWPYMGCSSMAGRQLGCNVGLLRLLGPSSPEWRRPSPQWALMRPLSLVAEERWAGCLGVAAIGKQTRTRKVGMSHKMWLIIGPENDTQKNVTISAMSEVFETSRFAFPLASFRCQLDMPGKRDSPLRNYLCYRRAQPSVGGAIPFVGPDCVRKVA